MQQDLQQRELTVIFVTGNANKLRETTAILASPPSGEAEATSSSPTAAVTIKLESRKIDLPELQGSTQEIARDKCWRAAELIFSSPAVPITSLDGDKGAIAMKVRRRRAVITEDTCLCFNALKGLPGPYIKHFLTSLGPDGLPRLLDGFGSEGRGAFALCTFAYCEEGAQGPEDVLLFEGKVDGRIPTSPQGPQTFGWDSIFIPNAEEGPGLGEKSFSQLEKEVKYSISHRGRALAGLKSYLQTRSF